MLDLNKTLCTFSHVALCTYFYFICFLVKKKNKTKKTLVVDHVNLNLY